MTTTPRNTRALTQGAMFAALTVMMVLAGVVFPPLQLLFYALPVPVAIATLSAGLNTGVLTGIVAGLLAGLVTRTPDTVLVVAAAGAVGIAIGYALEQRWPAVKALLFSSVISAVTVVIEFALTLWIVGLDQLMTGFKKSLEMTMQLAIKRPALFGAADPKAAEAMVQSMLQMYKLMIPSIILLSLVTLGVLNYFLTRAAAKRLGLPVGPGFPPFREWRFPKWFAVVYIVALAGTYLSQSMKGLGQVGLVVFANAQILFSLLFFLQGMAVAWHLFDHYKVDRVGRWVLTIIVFITGIGAQIVAFVGLFDVFLDYRKPREGSK